MCLKADFLFVQREQQQDGPAQQQANVLQEKHHPRPLVVDVDQGGKLNPGRRQKLGTSFRKRSCGLAQQRHTHHVSQPHIQEKACGDGGNPLFGGDVRGHRQSDVQAHEGSHGAAEVEEQSPADRHAAVQQNGKIP